MTPTTILSLIIGYFAVLIIISRITSRKANNQTFFLANKSAPWYLVAFGMIGASLSGITFISVPGKVGNAADQMSYFQMVLGFFFGYFFIAFVLLPIYYRMGVTSIYEYLEKRFNRTAYKTGAVYFLLSRTIGASVRLLLVATVLQEILFNDLGVPFWLTAMISILLIWLYTNKGGIKTIIFTDTLQTAFMLISLGLSIYLISTYLEIPDGELISTIASSPYSKTWFFENFALDKFHFAKEFLGGFLICITMTGMDQDMMQKNLACPNIKDAQKNMVSFAIILVVVNIFFLGLGALLYMYQEQVGLQLPLSESGSLRRDLLFPLVALDSEQFGIGLGIFFLLGLIAAAYSSADSALTSLTTSFCVDILEVDSEDQKKAEQTRKKVHIATSVVLFMVVMI
ncbi:MAG: sodium:solute symporter, partial [Bacteroidota bacterium]